MIKISVVGQEGNTKEFSAEEFWEDDGFLYLGTKGVVSPNRIASPTVVAVYAPHHWRSAQKIQEAK